MRNRAIVLGAIALLLAGLVAWGSPLFAAPAGPTPGAAGAPPAQPHITRRESVPPVVNGPAPRTGPASPFQPLTIPSFGPNVRANTDTQSPNRAQQEPSISVNPTNPLNVVAAAKDERAGANTKQDWIYTSTDGGQTWINQQFPLLAPASPFSSDPVVNWSDDGQVYVTALPYGGSSADGIQVARSTDGGLTFATGVKLPGSNSNSDKEWTWVDNNPGSPYYHRIYVAWMNFGAGNVVGFNYSSDRGQTWSNVQNITSAEQFPMPVALPNGDVMVSYYSFASTVAFRRSTNGGVTFSGTAIDASPLTDPNCPPDNSGCGIWRLNAIPATAVDRTNGDMVVVWADGRPSNTATVYYSRSTDNGATWTPGVPLASSGVGNTYQVEPWVEADEQGVFHAVWYDDRENPNTSIFHIYYSQSTDDGATWSPAVRISTATSDLRIGIPSSYALAAGDYINVTASHGNVYAAWTDTRSGSGEDIYVVRGIIDQGTATPTVTGTPPTATATVAPPIPTATSTTTFTAVPSITPIAPSTTPTAPAPSETLTPAAQTATPSATSTALPATATPTLCPITFSDVHETDYFYTPVRYLYCHGVISGYGDNTFRPYNNTTRAQMVKIVVLGFGIAIQTPAGGAYTFHDVPPGAPFFDVIETAAAHSIVSGYGCGPGGPGPCDPQNRPYFLPNNSVTRGQLSKIDAIAAGWTQLNPARATFSDVPPGSPFYTYVETAVCHNVVSGYGDGTFHPNAEATRGQISKIVYLSITQAPGVCAATPASIR